MTRHLSIVFYVDSVPFTEAVITGQTSLGGSESACLGLARSLAARGHDVHIFATKLESVDSGSVYDGVTWHSAENELADAFRFIEPDVFVSLRMPNVFALRSPAKLNVLWNQDLLIDNSAVGMLTQVDQIVYVSEYHRKQWQGMEPLVTALSDPSRTYVTKNGFDPALVAQAKEELGDTPRVPRRFIHISRPERGLDALLLLWPKIRAAYPDAELRICRYSSMYDAQGWGEVCKAYDAKVAKANAAVGGITYLGELDKVALYKELLQASLMLYPTSQPNFAETSCIAAIEAQACGLPIVASRRGALPETIAPEAGKLIDGDYRDAYTQEKFLKAIAKYVDQPMRWQAASMAGQRHVTSAYAFDTLAAQWEQWLWSTFEARSSASRMGILRQLLHWDNHAAALRLAHDIVNDWKARTTGVDALPVHDYPADVQEALAAIGLCGRVISQEEQTAEQYAKFAVQNPQLEAGENGRLITAAAALAEFLKDIPAPRILDVACGNGSMALALAARIPNARIHGIDYSDGVLALARKAVADEGYADRVTFDAITSWADWQRTGDKYDAVFCGEFIEHVEAPWALADWLESHCADGGRVLITTPCGPFAELLNPGIPRQRGHVHAFSMRDLATMFEGKREFAWRYLHIGVSGRGTDCGYWVAGWTPGGGSSVALDYDRQITVERPYARVMGMMITKDAEGWLYRCLSSIWPVVDGVVIYDTGSTDATAEVAARFPGVQFIHGEWPNSFAEARNRALTLAEPQADWLLWIDADETLENAHRLRLSVNHQTPFNGYVLRQNHLQQDAPDFFDVPVRVFRARQGVTFYGRVHEQPETAPDAGIVPAMQLADVDLLHYGYVRDNIRRAKMSQRNLPLLMQDIKDGPVRRLTYVLWMRDCVNVAMFERENHGGKLTARAVAQLRTAIKIYRDQGLDKFEDKYHAIAWEFYQQALDWLGTAYHVEWSLGIQKPHLRNSHPRPQRFFAETADELERIIGHKTAEIRRKLEPVSIDVAPFK